MKITVFGASGGVGTQLVNLAVQRGHEVRAVYRAIPENPAPAGAEILVSPDIFDRGFAARAARGAGAVVTAVGPNFARRHNARTQLISPSDLHQRLARTLVAALRESGSRPTLICVSTGSMGPADAAMGPGARLLFRFLRTVMVPNLSTIGRDAEAMEQELAASGLDWYAVRPVKLTDGPLTGQVQASSHFAMKTLSRADVAWYILGLAEDPALRTERTPIITSARRSKSRPAGLEDVAPQQAPSAR